MTVVKAWQYIYSHVEKEQSPQRQRGFQTLFYSHEGLNMADLQILERRVFLDVMSGVPYKRQCYSLSGGRVVVAQAVPLPEPDRMGRGGRYLFHNLIIEARDWERIGCHPFSIFAQQLFFTRLEAVLEQGDFVSGNIKPLSVDVKEINEAARIESLATNWSSDALIGLGWLALHAADLQQKQKRLALVGSQEVILNTLELAFLLASLEARKHCSFDTNFYRSDYTRTPVWMAGFSTSPAPEYAEISSASLLHSHIVSIQPKTPFEQWWLERIRSREFGEYVAQRDLALAMDSILQGTETEAGARKIRVARPEELSSFSRANVTSLQSLGEKAISRTFPAELTPRIVSEFIAVPENWWQVILDGMSLQDAAKRVDSIYRYHPAPSKRESVALEQLATQSQYEPLMFKVAFWGRAQNPTVWGKMLKEMSLQNYSTTGMELVKSRDINLFDWLCENKIDTWLNLSLPILASGQIVNAASCLVSAHRGDLLELLTPKVGSMSRAEQIALKKILQEYADLAPSLWRRILAAAEDKS